MVPELRRLVAVLEEERDLLERLLFKLVEARLVVAADERRFVSEAMREVETATETLRVSEARRSVALAELAAAVGTTPDALPFSRLASGAPEPYRTILTELRETFRRLAAEVEEAVGDNRLLVAEGLASVRERLGALLGGAGTYSPAGTGIRTPPAPLRVDEVL